MTKVKLVVILTSLLVFSACTSKTTPVKNSPTGIPSSTPVVVPSVFDPTPTVSIDEKDTIKSAIKQSLVAKHGATASELNVIVYKIVDSFSSGSASGNGGGGMWFAAKKNNQWQLVWDGNGQINCQDLTAYPDLPTSLIPECYDKSTDNMVER